MATLRTTVGMVILLILPVMFKMADGIKYTYQGLQEAVMHVCCYRGRRYLPSMGNIKPSTSRAAASDFLIHGLERRHLGYICCYSGGVNCRVGDILNTSLREECIHEGCSSEEIQEVC